VSSYFIETCEGHLIVGSNKHYENIYDIPEDVGSDVFKIARKMFSVMRKAYDSNGVTTLQNNEPAGRQHAFHYHLHLFSWYKNDDLYTHMMSQRETTLEERLNYVNKLRKELDSK